jgi:predicted negative regulator of RcsB-dependent stress response
MAVYDLEEQEKLDDLKAWWLQYGKYVGAALATVAIMLLASVGWRWYQQDQSAQASVLYQAVSTAGRDNDVAKAKEPATQIEELFPTVADVNKSCTMNCGRVFRTSQFYCKAL